MSILRPALFLDRDGVLNEEVNYLHDPKDLIMIPGVGEVIAECNRLGVPVIVITNQAGIGRGYYDVAAYESVNRAMAEHLAAVGAHVDAWYFCPHHPTESCTCRKPAPGMLELAARDWQLDLSRSVVVGDKESDLTGRSRRGCPRRSGSNWLRKCGRATVVGIQAPRDLCALCRLTEGRRVLASRVLWQEQRASGFPHALSVEVGANVWRRPERRSRCERVASTWASKSVRTCGVDLSVEVGANVSRRPGRRSRCERVVSAVRPRNEQQEMFDVIALWG
ncbi:MAG: HAD family hydrolase [Polyangiaceae bacterium]